ncbi:hypothetical protein [Geomonas azotofigens]|uniref:hypothetical protein n=1 Tax=Geomonas azotofigens TaxID=2843196 RepID=UPI001C1279AC|nr:hypothetical protein [Geomonas azotofigens]MBU5613177.1 hypothetical protein [Geomonas azotofigens]
MKLFFLRPLLRMLPLLLLVAVAGCGEVDWFPQYVREPITPDQFSFQPKPGTDMSVDVTSEAITVKGLTAASSPISISGATDSKYAINGGTATSSPGTVKNDDTVTVTHKSAATLGTSTTSTLTIGGVSADFVSTTKSVQLGAFSTPPTQNGGLLITHADVTDAVAGSLQVSIKDSINSGAALYQVTSTAVTDPDLALFTNVKQFFPLKGQRIFVRNLATNSSATTTLTIAGVDTVVPLKP